MVERIEGVPEGTIGLRASGELTREDYTEVLEPALAAAAAAGEIRLLFVLEDFDGLALGAYAEDVKTGLRAYVHDRASWRRMALVTDVAWIARAMRALSWLVPGEAGVFSLAQRDEAIAWVAARG